MCLNNVNVHFNSRIVQVIEEIDFIIKFLFFYSSDYSLIELSFNILKV